MPAQPITVTAIPALRDNYIWLLHDSQYAIAVDPSDAQPVIAYCQQHQLTLNAILITHHHHDHINGVKPLIEKYPQASVYASSYGGYHGKYAFLHTKVQENDLIDFARPALQCRVLHIPGHTLDHVAYLVLGQPDKLFCGDTLFSAGCGRLFEGSATQLAQSLLRIANLPKETEIYCAHEYTEKNILFAIQEQPANPYLAPYLARVKNLQAEQTPTLPTTLATEYAINPFLQCLLPNKSALDKTTDKTSLENAYPISITTTALENFTQLRIKRNYF